MNQKVHMLLAVTSPYCNYYVRTDDTAVRSTATVTRFVVLVSRGADWVSYRLSAVVSPSGLTPPVTLDLTLANWCVCVL